MSDNKSHNADAFVAVISPLEFARFESQRITQKTSPKKHTPATLIKANWSSTNLVSIYEIAKS